jgi:RNA polymerase sigma factor (sigma-70 family)
MTTIDGTLLTTSHELSARLLFACEIKHLPTLSWHEQQELVERTRQGDAQAGEELIISCLRCVLYRAWDIYLLHQPLHIDHLDLAQVGALALVRTLPLALAKKNPGSYLYGVARREISYYCAYYAPLIHKPHRTLAELATLQIPAVVASLDEPGPLARESAPDHQSMSIDPLTTSMPSIEELEEEAEEQKRQRERYQFLYDAIDSLSPRQREMLIRAYGLFGEKQESNAELGEIGRWGRSDALASLRKKLGARR